jgi:NADPH:quinone reductase-like Zn-dependent oxidoreductase
MNIEGALKKMRRVVVSQPGGPEVLKVETTDPPRPRPGEALVRVAFASVNAADMWTRRPNVIGTYPHVPGSDAAGYLVECNGESEIQPGAEVVICPALAAKSSTVEADRPFGEIVKILGYDTPGTFAELVTVPIENVFLKPTHLSLSNAAAVPLTYLTAWRMLRTRAQVKPEDTVLVWGASGGLGCAAVSIAKLHGARVIAMVGSDADANALREYGADITVSYKDEDLAGKLKSATGDRGVDIVFDSVAGDTWSTTLAVLRPGGRLVLAGTTAGDIVSFDLSDVFYYQWAIFGCRMGDNHEFSHMLRAIEQAGVQPRVAIVIPMEKVVDSHRLMEAGDYVGKIVVQISES